MAIKNLIQLRKGSASEWSSINPILASGEPGYDLTNNIIKIGDGYTSWNNLSGIGTSSSSSSSVDLDTTLIAGTGIGFSYDSSNNSLYINITGQLGLSTEEVDDRVNALLNSGYGISLNYNDSTNSLTISSTGLQPSGNYAASSHSHLVADVSGLQASLDSKQPSGSYAASSHTHTASNITDFNSSVSGLVSGVYAPLSGATFIGPVSATSGNFSSGINITSSSGSIYTSGSNIYFLNNNAGNLFFIGDQGGGDNVLAKYRNATTGPFMFFRKYRGSYSSPSIVAAGDNLGSIQFETMNYDGTIITQCARIQAATEAAPASGLTNLASQLRFFTSTSSDTFNAPTQRMVITSSGLVGINKTVPTSTLDVAGLITSNSGNFTSSLRVNSVNVSISGHTHSSSNITDFNSSVSGLLPVTNIVAGSNISVSSASGVYTVNSIPLISYSDSTSFPASGVSTSYYLASDSSRFYQWTGSQYVEIGSPPTTISANDPTVGLTLLHPFLLGGM